MKRLVMSGLLSMLLGILCATSLCVAEPQLDGIGKGNHPAGRRFEDRG